MGLPRTARERRSDSRAIAGQAAARLSWTFCYVPLLRLLPRALRRPLELLDARQHLLELGTQLGVAVAAQQGVALVELQRARPIAASFRQPGADERALGEEEGLVAAVEAEEARVLERLATASESFQHLGAQELLRQAQPADVLLV